MPQTIISRLSFTETRNLLQKKLPELSDNGTFYAVFSTEYDEKGNVVHDVFELIDTAVKAGYTYVNTIVYPTDKKQEVYFCDNVRYVVWLCKNHGKMTFDKDAIREKHIWKDVEWGKRKKNYNPKGKDPGNVWIPTIDDGKANITEHIRMPDNDVVKRLLAMSECKDDYELHWEEVQSAALILNRPECPCVNEEVYGKVYFKSSEQMEELGSDSVDVVVTSPPYWNLKDYFKEGQIGKESYPKYLERMRAVWAECYDKLSQAGSLWVNINIRVSDGNVILIPYDFIKMCREIGFYYKGIVIWHKSSGIPTNNKNIVDRHEYVLVFSKSENMYIDRSTMESCRDYKNEDINGGAFWNINRKAGSVGKKYIHPAIYPNELVKRIVLAATRRGGLVLDPFLGSGTTVIAAMQCGRKCIGYEYNDGFKELIQSRCKGELPHPELVQL